MVAAIAAPGALAALLCAYRLTTRSMWLDEGSTYAITAQHGAALWRAIAHDGGNMLVFYVAIHVLTGLFGVGLVVLRTPSVLADACTAMLTAILALRLFGARQRRLAAAAGVLCAVSLPLVFWGQDARGYAWMVTFTAASMLALHELIDGRGSPRLALLCYVAATLLALYVGFDCVIVIPAQVALVWMLRRDRLWLLIGALVVVALCCIPLVVLAMRRGSGQLFWVGPLTISGAWDAWATLSSAGMPPNFHDTILRIPLAAVTGIAVVVFAAAAVRHRLRPALVPAGWVLGSAALALIAALAGEPVELSRATVLLMPGLALLLAWGLVGRRGGWPGWGLLVAVVVLRAVVLAPSYGVSPEPWQRTADEVSAAARARPACVAFYPQDGREPFGYYVRAAGGAPGLTPVLPPEPWRVVRPHVEEYSAGDPGLLHGIAGRCARLFVIASHQGQATGPPNSRRDDRRYRQLLADLGALYPHVASRQLGYAAVIHVTLFSK